MPDTKFSFKALKEHLRKYLWVYIIGVIVCLLGSDVLWTMTRPRTPDDQLVEIYLMDAYSDAESMQRLFADSLLERGKAYDPTLEEIQFLSLSYTSAEEDYYAPMVLMARLSTGEADVFLCSENGLEGLLGNGVCLPLDAYYAEGWMADTGLEPYYQDILLSEETGETETQMVALRIDNVNALAQKNIFQNQGAYLVITGNGTNIDTSMHVAEDLIRDLLAMEEESGEAESDVPADSESEG